MKNIDNYIVEKLVIDNTVHSYNKIVNDLCNRLTDTTDEKFKYCITTWLENNNIEDLDGDIFYSVSNVERLKQYVNDSNYVKSASKFDTGSDLLKGHKLNNLFDSHCKKYGSTSESIYISSNKLIFVRKSRDAIKYVIYMNAWKNEKT